MLLNKLFLFVAIIYYNINLTNTIKVSNRNIGMKLNLIKCIDILTNTIFY